MIQDPTTSQSGEKITEGFDPANEDFFLDGPVTKRLAILDFSPENGELVQGARFHPPPIGRVRGWYQDEDGNDVYRAKKDELSRPSFLQVSTFATVLKTMYLFEGTGNRKIDTLGRSLTWAFNNPQLLIVPRAGQRANAYYSRNSNSLQFFYFPSPKDPKKNIFTCLSRDIVAHETGHAIIDGIVPDLVDACTPQSLAIHEAIADLTALLMAFQSHNLRKIVLKMTGGSITKPTEFCSIGEEFGLELWSNRKGLRNLYNNKSLNPEDENFVKVQDKHSISEVLSGALYSVMMNIHENLKDELKDTPEYSKFEDPRYSASGKALLKGANRFKRMIFRALDYLPPGEVTFADYGRAIIAVDLVAYPDDNKMRNWIIEQFVNRKMIESKAALDVETYFKSKEPIPNVKNLYESDWAAYDFANKSRELLFIPEKVQFQIRPRIVVRKKYDKDKVVRECIFKVIWDHVESNPIGNGYPEERFITVGTTLVLGLDSNKILARLTNVPPSEQVIKENTSEGSLQIRIKEYDLQWNARNEFLKLLANEDLIELKDYILNPDGRELHSKIQAQIVGGKLRIKRTGKMLHILEEWSK
jgi:hypothetical protein